MKMLSKYLFGVLFSVLCTHSFAQTNDTRPALYGAYPSTISIDKILFDQLLSNETGTVVSLPLTADFNFEGTVISNITKYNNMHTVMLRSVSNAESIFQITRILNEENKFLYAGRIINKNAADGYEIKNTDGAYFLQKFETLKMLDPCKL